MAQPVSRVQRVYGERIGPRRRLALAVTSALHAVLTRISGRTLGGLPRVAGIPVLRGPGAGPASRAKLEAGLELLADAAPGRKNRLRANVLGIFLARQPSAHGHYSRITGTCTLDLERLAGENSIETAAALVRCATEAWLWRAGRGRATDDEYRILALSERAGRQFVRRVRASTIRPLR
ncbi:MAG: hypothetical protein H0W29_18690 [Gemmatimonadales bacterium]|nr:hypothetical protein [Gemmatimonadales bacterium]